MVVAEVEVAYMLVVVFVFHLQREQVGNQHVEVADKLGAALIKVVGKRVKQMYLGGCGRVK